MANIAQAMTGGPRVKGGSFMYVSQAGWRNTSRRLAVLVLAVLAVAVVAVAWWLVAGREFVFLVVEESNGAPPGLWTGQEQTAAAWYDVTEQKLTVPEGRLWPWDRVICLYEVDAAGVRVSSRLLRGCRWPFSVPLRDPVPALEGASRVVAADLRLLGISDGHLRLSYDGRQFYLAPGESWAQLRVAGRNPLVAGTGRGVWEADDEEAWERAVDQALTAGTPVTRLLVTYYGRWRHGGHTLGRSVSTGTGGELP